MKFIKNILRSFIIGTISITLFLIFYPYISTIEEKTGKELINLSINDIEYITNNIKEEILQKAENQDFISFLLLHEDIRKEIEKKMSIILTGNIKYFFIIIKDADDNFRFLLDASTADKSNLGELFEPLPEEKNLINQIYTEKKAKYILHKNINTIGFTYIKPIIQDNQIKALFFVDFSTRKLKSIQEITETLKNILVGTLFIIILLTTISIYNTFRTYLIRKKAYIDNLTSLYNRNYLQDIMDIIDLDKFDIALIDIDHFKKINDSYGHDIGDIVLKEVANIIKTSIKDKEDIAIRYGGEEFLLILKKDKEDKYATLNILKRIRENVKNLIIDTKGWKVKVTVSIGVNLDTFKSGTLADAIKKADIALYQAKNKGRDRIEIYQEEEDKLIFIQHLKELIENKKLICYYQPIINLKENKISHFEALTRIIDNNGKIIYPYEFLPILSGRFLYSKFTKALIEYNIEILKKYPKIKISINLLPSDIFDESIIYILKEINQELRNRIILEIVETEGIHSYELFVNNLIKLKKEYGYKICIDNFGVGYSNFVHLLKIKADYLKLDGSIIKNIHKYKISYYLAETIVTFCKRINVKTVAEHIENSQILEKVKELKIDYGQGFLFYKPIPIEEAVKLIEKENQ